MLVKPGSRRGPRVEADADPRADLVVHIREHAADGAANTGVDRALARHYGTSPSRVSIARGHAARLKRVRVDVEDDVDVTPSRRPGR